MSEEMPITGQMHYILQEGKAPREAIRELMTRPAARESGLVFFVCLGKSDA